MRKDSLMKRTIRLLGLLLLLALPLQAANELTGSVTLTFSKNGAVYQRASALTVTVTGAYVSSGVASIATSDGTLSLAGVGTIGYVYFKNLDATNYITIGPDGSSYPIKLKAGESALARWNSAAIHALAHTAACKLEYSIIED